MSLRVEKIRNTWETLGNKEKLRGIMNEYEDGLEVMNIFLHIYL